MAVRQSVPRMCLNGSRGYHISAEIDTLPYKPLYQSTSMRKKFQTNIDKSYKPSYFPEFFRQYDFIQRTRRNGSYKGSILARIDCYKELLGEKYRLEDEILVKAMYNRQVFTIQRSELNQSSKKPGGFTGLESKMNTDVLAKFGKDFYSLQVMKFVLDLAPNSCESKNGVSFGILSGQIARELSSETVLHLFLKKNKIFDSVPLRSFDNEKGSREAAIKSFCIVLGAVNFSYGFKSAALFLKELIKKKDIGIYDIALERSIKY